MIRNKLRFLASFLILALVLVGISISPVQTKAAVDPELPRIYIDTTYPTLAAGRTVRNVKTSCIPGESECYTSLQTAIDKSILGDEIIVQAGMKIAGPITLKNKTSGTGWIVIHPSDMNAIPSAQHRIDPSFSAAMPKIESPGSNISALVTENQAHNYRIVGLEFREAVANDDSNVLIQLGTPNSYCATSTEPYKICDQSVLSNYAYNIILDRIYVHGDPQHNVKRGIAMDSKAAALIDSYVSDIHVVGQDAQAISGFNGAGPYKIVNNYLEGAGENLIFGGDDPRVQDLSSSDIEIRNNYFFKPLSWRQGDPSYAGKHWQVKNIFELKNAQRVIVDGNVMENNWSDAQPGVAVLINSTNQYGRCSWCAARDVTFSNNIIRHSGGGMSFQANDYNYPASTGRTARVRVYNNLWYDLDGKKWGNLATGTKASDYLFYLPSGAAEPGPDDIQIIHNTAIDTGTMIQVDRNNGTSFYTKAGFVFTDNIAPHNAYGVFGTGASGFDDSSITSYFPDAVFTKNLIMGQHSATDTRDWSDRFVAHAGNFFAKTWTDVGFVNQAQDDYHLSLQKYKNAGTDGQDIGANIDAINAAIAGAFSPSTTPTPPPVTSPTPPAPAPSPVPPASPPPVSSGGGGGGTVTPPTAVEELSSALGIVYPDGKLILDNGTVYVIEAGLKRAFVSSSVFLTLGYKFSNVILAMISSILEGNGIFTAQQRHPRGSVVNDHGTIYYLGKDLRYPFPSGEVFFSWGHAFKDVLPANSYDLAMPVGEIVQTK
ncbi:MAG: hypothetical protein KW802_02665 [Candidatus Doudnabacteria bacterium]|nr:hypothetical protein [Candidatus Doudnabacteria bacterium]